MSSLRKILASRANALKSTGPRSPMGKRISSQNAIIHGFTAKKSIVLNGESRERFERLQRTLFDFFRPSSEVTALFVEEMTVAQWRIRRLWAIEAALYDHELDSIREHLQKTYATLDNEVRIGLAYRSLNDRSSCPTGLRHYEVQLTRQFERACAMFLLLESHAPGNEPADSSQIIELPPQEAA